MMPKRKTTAKERQQESSDAEGQSCSIACDGFTVDQIRMSIKSKRLVVS